MRERRLGSVDSPWRAGWRYGVVACAVGALDLGVQKLRHLFGWPLATTTWLNWLAIAVPIVLVITASYRAAHVHGNLKLGAWAGTIAGVIPAAVLGLVVAVYTIVTPSKKLPPPENLKTALIILVVLPFLGGMCGYALAYVPAWAGRLVFRRNDPQYAAMRAARPRLSPTERIKKWQRENLGPIFAVLGLGCAGVAILVLPAFIASWVRANTPGWRIMLAVGAATLAIALYVAFRSHRYVRVGTNWLALFLLALALLLGFPGSDTSWIAFISRLLIPSLSTWFIVANGIDDVIGMRKSSQLTGDDPPLPPVYFHDGGARLTYYPSRRTLAGHLLFASTLGLLCLAIFFIRAIPVGIQLGVAAFGVMALVFGAIPDVTRLLVRRPSLVVTGEGIIDLVSAGLYGVGLIPWRQVWGLFPTPSDLRHGRFAEVHILSRDVDSLIAAQPFYKRPLLKLATTNSLGIAVSALVLSPPPEQIVEQIMAYMEQYGPADYVSAFTDEDDRADEDHSEGEPTD